MDDGKSTDLSATDLSAADHEELRKKIHELWDKIHPAYGVADGSLYPSASPTSVAPDNGRAEASTESKEGNNPMADRPSSTSPIPADGLLHDDWFDNWPQPDGFWKTNEAESVENEVEKAEPDSPEESQEMYRQPEQESYWDSLGQEEKDTLYQEMDADMKEIDVDNAHDLLSESGYQITAPEPQQELSPETREELSSEIMAEYANDNEPQPEIEPEIER